MKICLIQPDIAWGDPQANCEHLDRLIGAGAADGTDLYVLPEMFTQRYSSVFECDASTTDEGMKRWNAIPAGDSDLFPWDLKSTYIQEPPFMTEMTAAYDAEKDYSIRSARVLLALGDSITTDHISPAGAIKNDSPAGLFLQQNGVDQKEFNSYGSRRGNDRVMTRVTFANIRLRNLLAPGTEGGVTRFMPSGEQMSVYDAAVKYRAENVPLIVLAGAEYGTGSSRDWAAKGACLLGVRAVIAQSYERIHRSNLVGMGVLPLQFQNGESWQSLGLTGEEVFDIQFDMKSLKPAQTLAVTAKKADGTEVTFNTTVRIDTPVEIEYYRNGGILQTVLRKLL